MFVTRSQAQAIPSILKRIVEDRIEPMEDEEQTLSSPRTGEPGKKLEDEEQTIAQILDLVNSPYKQFLNENDKILKQILDGIFMSLVIP